jgi:hypothetical protein
MPRRKVPATMLEIPATRAWRAGYFASGALGSAGVAGAVGGAGVAGAEFCAGVAGADEPG